LDYIRQSQPATKKKKRNRGQKSAEGKGRKKRKKKKGRGKKVSKKIVNLYQTTSLARGGKKGKGGGGKKN